MSLSAKRCADNRRCLELIEGAGGMLRLLDEEVVMLSGTIASSTLALGLDFQLVASALIHCVPA